MAASKVQVWNRALARMGETERVESEEEDRLAAEVCRTHWDDVLRAAFESYDWPWAMRDAVLTSIDTQEQTTAGDAAETEFDVPFSFRETAQLTVTWVYSDGSEEELEPTGGATTYTYALTDDTDTGGRAYVTISAAPNANESIRISITTERLGWSHVYPLPSDCVTPIAVVTDPAAAGGASVLYFGLTGQTVSSGGRHANTPVASRIPYAVEPNESGDGYLVCCDSENIRLVYVALIDYVPALPALFVDAIVWGLAAELARALAKDHDAGDRCQRYYVLALAQAAASAKNLGHETEAETPTVTARR